MPQKLSHEADPQHVPDVVYVSSMEMRPNRVAIGLVAGAIILVLGVGGAFIITNFILTDTTPLPSLDIKKASPSAKVATPSTQKNETEGWKVYINNTYDYQIKYPKNWELNGSDTGKVKIVEKPSGRGLLIGVEVEEGFDDLDDWFSKLSSNTQSTDKIIESKNITIGEEPAYFIKFEDMSGQNFYNVITIHNNVQFQLVFTHTSVDTLEAMLSTLKFLD